MAGPSVAHIKNRIVAIGGDISGINTALDDWPEDNFPFTSIELPALIVTVDPAVRYTKISIGSLLMTRNYAMTVVAARVTNDTQSPDTDALEAIEPFLISVPLKFITAPRLERNDAGLAFGTELGTEPFIDRFTFNRAVYIGAVIPIAVTTIHS